MISVIVILLIIAGVILIYVSSNEDKIINQNINIEPLTNAGSSVLTCDVNADCIDICDIDNECLIPSCTKNPTKSEGTCVCLDICGS